MLVIRKDYRLGPPLPRTLTLTQTTNQIKVVDLNGSHEYDRDGPPPDFSGIPEFFFYLRGKKKT